MSFLFSSKLVSSPLNLPTSLSLYFSLEKKLGRTNSPVRSPTIPCLSHTLIRGRASGSFASIKNLLVRSGG